MKRLRLVLVLPALTAVLLAAPALADDYGVELEGGGGQGFAGIRAVGNVITYGIVTTGAGAPTAAQILQGNNVVVNLNADFDFGSAGGTANGSLGTGAYTLRVVAPGGNLEAELELAAEDDGGGNGGGNGGDETTIGDLVDTGDVSACVEDANTLCLLGGRFEVTLEFELQQGATGPGQAHALTDDTGYFDWPSAERIQIIAQMLNACIPSLGNRYWVFLAGLTNQEVDLTVRDTTNGQARTYSNPLQHAFDTIQDTSLAFPFCA